MRKRPDYQVMVRPTITGQKRYYLRRNAPGDASWERTTYTVYQTHVLSGAEQVSGQV